MGDTQDLKPRFPIRRFDVFAEYNRLKYRSQGMADDVAAGRGVWVAKVVAARRGGAAAGAPSDRGKDDGKGERRAEPEERFLSVGGEQQTDETFDREIVQRMGREFYEQVFSPALTQAFEQGRRYEDIRDSIRKSWKR